MMTPRRRRIRGGRRRAEEEEGGGRTTLSNLDRPLLKNLLERGQPEGCDDELGSFKELHLNIVNINACCRCNNSLY